MSGPSWRQEHRAAPEGRAALTAGTRARAALHGVREPIVVVLLLIALFTAISGKPLDGLLMLLAATGLAWDAGHRALERATAVPGSLDDGGAPAGPLQPGGPQPAGAAAGAGMAAQEGGAVPAPARQRALAALAAVVASAAYAVIVGTFSRYSWPATAAVIGLGATVVVLGWHGPLVRRPDPGRLPLGGVLAWGGVLVAGSLWELWALLHQPTLTTSSYAHPTISTLTDPVLASAPGRAGVLALWLAVGWYLVRR